MQQDASTTSRPSNVTPSPAVTALLALAVVTASGTFAAAHTAEARPKLAESPSMRAVVAAVTAMAREMAGGEQTITAAANIEPAADLNEPQQTARRRAAGEPPPVLNLLPAEHLLDLPPPAC